MSNPTHDAMSAQIALLVDGLYQAANVAEVALDDMGDREQNCAIGGLLPLVTLLPELTAILTVLIVLHRRHPEGGGS